MVTTAESTDQQAAAPDPSGRHADDADHLLRLQRYNVLRFVVAFFVLAGTFALAWWQDLADWGVLSPLANVTAVALVGLIATTVWSLRRVVRATFVYGQLLLDVAFATALAAYTGGIDSFLTFLYVPTIGAGAYLLGARGSLVVAAMSTLGIGVLAVLERSTGIEETAMLYSGVLFRSFAYVLLAILTGRLASLLEEAGAELREQKAASETVLDRVHAGVLTSDAEGRVVGANPAAVRMLGDVVGQPLDAVLPGRATAERWEQAGHGERRFHCSQATLPSGGHVVVLDDVTELMRMRERMARDAQLVLVGRFASSVAHEIRNPLASLSGSLQFIREEHKSRLIDLAIDECRRLNRLVEDFLDTARPPSIQRQWIDLAAVASEVAESFAQDPRFRENVRVTCSGDVVRVSADPDRMRQVLWNLLLNAAQAMPRGGHVQIVAEEVGTDAVVVVRDDGPGVPPEDLDHLFDPYHTRRAGGLGIGLAVVDQVVRIHGGRVDVRAPAGGGTEFRVILPREATLG